MNSQRTGLLLLHEGGRDRTMKSANRMILGAALAAMSMSSGAWAAQAVEYVDFENAYVPACTGEAECQDALSVAVSLAKAAVIKRAPEGCARMSGKFSYATHNREYSQFDPSTRIYTAQFRVHCQIYSY
jgi:hypothetical protein